MILAHTLKTLTTFTAPALSRMAGEDYTSAEFLGLTNAGEFCYAVNFLVHGGTDSKKVFLRYDTDGLTLVDKEHVWHYN